MSVLLGPPCRPSQLESGRCLLFAYGKLQPDQNPPRSMSRAWPDRMRGSLYDLGPFPAAINIGTSNHWFWGYVLEIAENELVGDLDAYEALDAGLYRRLLAVTSAGFEVWVYEYSRALPATAVGPLERWPLGPD